MPSSNPITMTFPPFAGTVRKLVIVNAAVFLGYLLLAWLLPGLAAFAFGQFTLQPLALLHLKVWQLVTYSFFEFGLLAFLFNMLTIWLCGSILEGSYGSRWLAELYFSSAIGGALLAAVISFTGILHLSPESIAFGASSGIFGILVALAMRFGDLEFLLFFVARIRVKYLVAIYIFIDVVMLLRNNNAFSALLSLTGGVCGYLYVQFAPRKGLAFGFIEQYFGMRNAYYRAKRRRAARKFEVYMGKQGRKVHFDKDGRYVNPDEARKDPNDKRWMN
jgi:membrane associated rhomboid family serine protease